MEKLLFLAALVMFSMSPVDINLVLRNPAATNRPGTPVVLHSAKNTVNQPPITECFAYAAVHYTGNPSIERADNPRASNQHNLACRGQTHNH
jgi:hypothetical protein